MITIKVFYENGDIAITRFNGDITEAKNYYLNKEFNIGTVTDNLVKCIKVKEI